MDREAGRGMMRVLTLVVMTGVLSACAKQDVITWKVFPLQRNSPHDGLAVVSQPDGYTGFIYIWKPTPAIPTSACLAGCPTRRDCSMETARIPSVLDWRLAQNSSLQ